MTHQHEPQNDMVLMTINCCCSGSDPEKHSIIELCASACDPVGQVFDEISLGGYVPDETEFDEEAKTWFAEHYPDALTDNASDKKTRKDIEVEMIEIFHEFRVTWETYTKDKGKKKLKVIYSSPNPSKTKQFVNTLYKRHTKHEPLSDLWDVSSKEYANHVWGTPM